MRTSGTSCVFWRSCLCRRRERDGREESVFTRKPKYTICPIQITVTTIRPTGAELMNAHDAPSNTVTGIKIFNFAAIDIVFRATRLSNTVLYSLVERNHLFSLRELRAKQTAASRINGVVGIKGSAAPRVPRAKLIKPTPPQRYETAAGRVTEGSGRSLCKLSPSTSCVSSAFVHINASLRTLCRQFVSRALKVSYI